MQNLKDLTLDEKLNQLLEGMQILLDKVKACHRAVATHDDATTKRLNYIVGEMNMLTTDEDGHEWVRRHPPFSTEVHPPDSKGN